jgi:hypothetical protein
MKYNRFWSSLVGLVIGVAVGFALSARFDRPALPKSSALLREFSFVAVAAQLGQANWQVLEDRTYEPFPAQARSQRIARRIVARADLADAELEKFTTQFQDTATKAMETYGAVNKAQFDMAQGSARVINGSPVRSRMDLPRRYYAIGDIHGVADLWYIAESGRVTVIVSLIEGL